MKKIIISAFIILAAVSCYDPSQDATVRINLGNIPSPQNIQMSFIDRVMNIFEKRAYAAAPGVFRVHIAAYSGNTVTATASFDVTAELPRDTVEISVPAGDGITILVVGEYNDGQNNISAGYFGFGVADLKAGISSDLTIDVYNLDTVQGTSGLTWRDIINLRPNGTYDTILWNSPGFPVKFHLYNYEWNGSEYVEVPVYEGTGFQAPFSTGYDFRLYLEFESFDLRSGMLETNFG